MAELTIIEARKIYSKSDLFKDLMLTKFSKEELEQVSPDEFDKKDSSSQPAISKYDAWVRHNFSILNQNDVNRYMKKG
jgi:hypothetical protein